MKPALQELFEAQLAFKDSGGDPILDRVFVGDTEIFPLTALARDSEAYREEFVNWRERWLADQSAVRVRILTVGKNAKRYADLKASVAGSKIIPVIGSGMSAPSAYPLWSSLIRKLAHEVMSDPSKIEPLLESGDFESAADVVRNATNKKLFNEQVEHALRTDQDIKILGAVRLLPLLFPKLAVTFNLDGVLERLYELSELPFEKVLMRDDLPSFRKLNGKGSSILLKLHGDCLHPSSYVLGTKEYDAAYGPTGKSRAELENIYRNNALLFLGCSLSGDRPLDSIRGIVAEDENCPNHFTFLPVIEGRAESISREDFLTDRGIFPIWYDGEHDESITALLVGLAEDLI